jgi:hypothetical protein
MKKATLLFVVIVFTLFLLSIAPSVKSAEMIDRQAMDILLNMTNTVAGAKQISVILRSSYDAPQANGQMVEFGAVRKIQIKRPDNMRIDKQRSDGDQRILVFDGKQIIIHNVTENVYARVEKVGSVDDFVKYLVSVLRFQLPLARMFQTNFTVETKKLVEEIDYVEQNILTDVPTDHLAARGKDVDFQIWIAQGKEPLPRRIVLTYKNIKGEPQFRANFSDWNLSAKAAKEPFTYTLPKNAEQIPLLDRIREEEGIALQEGGTQ